MKYMTKDWYKNMMNITFPTELEVICWKENNLEKTFIEQYKNKFNEIKNELPKGIEEYVFQDIFRGYLQNVKTFFDKQTLKRVKDIRLLALGKVFIDEYKLIDEEIRRKDKLYAYHKEFNKIKNNIPKVIKENLALHDSLITGIIKEKDKLIIELDSTASRTNIKSVELDTYKIIEEEMNFINSWWLYEELYIDDNKNYELHILLEENSKKEPKLGYFTVKAQDIKFQ